MNKKDIIIIVVISIIIFIILNEIYNGKNKEHLTPASNEAVQNLASVYNSSTMVTGDLVVTRNFNLLPRGVIIAWWMQGPPPAGWAICDGTNGTPDLRNRFILGCGMNEQDPRPFGRSSVTLTIDNLPPHSHGMCPNYRGYLQNGTLWGFGDNNSCDNRRQTSSVGRGMPFDIMPPHLKIAYIMRL